ncbi:MAG TPA: hypothetical protein VHZ55_03545 [Bryobacteraceae bacterium]|jgi:membrane protein implicated in regulation of membrane protease activity|nr:hypothetical protein [Bryobacteraceae bacterium]
MATSDIFLLCFAVGAVWTLVAWLLGAGHLGHGHSGHAHTPGAGHHATSARPGHTASGASWLSYLVNPASAAVFLTWFGGVGYLLTRHTGLEFWLDLAIAGTLGAVGALLIASFLRFLQAREKPLDPADYYLPGTLGRVSSTIRPDGVGEVIYIKDGARRPICARSDSGDLVQRGAEVVITRFEKGVAYVRTWDAMLTQPETGSSLPETLHKETRNVE